MSAAHKPSKQCGADKMFHSCFRYCVRPGDFLKPFDGGMDFLTWNGMKMTGADDRGPDTDRR